MAAIATPKNCDLYLEQKWNEALRAEPRFELDRGQRDAVRARDRSEDQAARDAGRVRCAGAAAHVALTAPALDHASAAFPVALNDHAPSRRHLRPGRLRLGRLHSPSLLGSPGGEGRSGAATLCGRSLSWPPWAASGSAHLGSYADCTALPARGVARSQIASTIDAELTKPLVSSFRTASRSLAVSCIAGGCVAVHVWRGGWGPSRQLRATSARSRSPRSRFRLCSLSRMASVDHRSVSSTVASSANTASHFAW